MTDLKIIFRCEAAGREYNEDNGKILQLGENRGVLLVVCDGMGGMKAGEVASALAVATIEEWFDSKRLTPQAISDPLNYLKLSIVGADANIKNYSKMHPETEGMGSTVVLTWLLGEKAYVAWCGDSRAYRYNSQLGLERLSHDHSLVQSWVDAGQITEEQAFEHPQSNIITRSLGDPKGEAMPDAAEYAIYNNDIFLLCSDGLCGTLRDKEIEGILSENKDLSQCCEQLWQADKAAGWHDNVTTAMAQVVLGGGVLSIAKQEDTEPQELEIIESNLHRRKWFHFSSKYVKYILVVILFLCTVLFAYLYLKEKQKNKQELPQVEISSKPDENLSVQKMNPPSQPVQIANISTDKQEAKSDSVDNNEN